MTLISPNQEEFGNFGEVVAGAGDVDGDGVPDLIVGAGHEDPGNSPDLAGRAYVFSGQDGSLLLELVSPNEEADGVFGDSVGGAGDVNRDGFADVIVGAPGEGPGTRAGRTYVISGKDGSLIWELTSPNEGPGDGSFGDSVAGAGDTNQDGFVDLIVGAHEEEPDGSPRDAGRTYVFSGRDGSLLLELKSPNEEEESHFGYSVASLGDLNQDGAPDLLIGAPFEGPPSGGAYVFSGRDGRLIFHLFLGTTPVRGRSVAGAGDVNQDGFPDGIIGASASACVFSGQDGSLLDQLWGPLNPGKIVLDTRSTAQAMSREMRFRTFWSEIHL